MMLLRVRNLARCVVRVEVRSDFVEDGHRTNTRIFELLLVDHQLGLTVEELEQ